MIGERNPSRLSTTTAWSSALSIRMRRAPRTSSG